MSVVLLAMTVATANFALGFALAIYLGHGPALAALVPRRPAAPPK
jgi:hypothetical protein